MPRCLLAAVLVACTGCDLAATDYCVDALHGVDAPGRAQSASLPCRTLSYALSTLRAAGPGPHTIYIAGGMTYSHLTNGEVFPLVLPRDIAIVGFGAEPPRILAPSGIVVFSYGAPTVPARCSLSRIFVDGGDIGLDVRFLSSFGHGMGAHDVAVTGCKFRGQGQVGVTCWTQSAQSDPGYWVGISDCEFENGNSGCSACLSTYGGGPTVSVSGCTFRNMSGTACSASVDSKGGWSWSVSDCRFVDVHQGIVAGSGYNQNSASVQRCVFVRCAGTAISVDEPVWDLITLGITGCTILDCGKGIRLGIDNYGIYGNMDIADNFISGCATGMEFVQTGPSQRQIVLGMSRNWIEHCAMGLQMSLLGLLKVDIDHLRMHDNVSGLHVTEDHGSLLVDASIFDGNQSFGLDAQTAGTLVTCRTARSPITTTTPWHCKAWTLLRRSATASSTTPARTSRRTSPSRSCSARSPTRRFRERETSP